MSDTPETDEHNNRYQIGGYTLDFCRKLERERDDAIKMMKRTWDNSGQIIASQANENILLTEQRDELRNALSLAGKLCHQVHHPKSMQHGDLDSCPVEAFIQQALYKKP